MGRLHDAKLIVDDSPGMSVEQMRARARRVKRQHGLDLIVVDYLQLMQGRGDNRVEESSRDHPRPEAAREGAAACRCSRCRS
jgi:replicative DNA helicase